MCETTGQQDSAKFASSMIFERQNGEVLCFRFVQVSRSGRQICWFFEDLPCDRWRDWCGSSNISVKMGTQKFWWFQGEGCPRCFVFLKYLFVPCVWEITFSGVSDFEFVSRPWCLESLATPTENQDLHYRISSMEFRANSGVFTTTQTVLCFWGSFVALLVALVNVGDLLLTVGDTTWAGLSFSVLILEFLFSVETPFNLVGESFGWKQSQISSKEIVMNWRPDFPLRVSRLPVISQQFFVDWNPRRWLCCSSCTPTSLVAFYTDSTG